MGFGLQQRRRFRRPERHRNLQAPANSGRQIRIPGVTSTVAWTRFLVSIVVGLGKGWRPKTNISQWYLFPSWQVLVYCLRNITNTPAQSENSGSSKQYGAGASVRLDPQLSTPAISSPKENKDSENKEIGKNMFGSSRSYRMRYSPSKVA